MSDTDKTYTITLVEDSTDIHTALAPSGIPEYTVDSSVAAVHTVTMDQSWGDPLATMVAVDGTAERPEELPLISSVVEA